MRARVYNLFSSFYTPRNKIIYILDSEIVQIRTLLFSSTGTMRRRWHSMRVCSLTYILSHVHIRLLDGTQLCARVYYIGRYMWWCGGYCFVFLNLFFLWVFFLTIRAVAILFKVMHTQQVDPWWQRAFVNRPIERKKKQQRGLRCVYWMHGFLFNRWPHQSYYE